MIRVAALMFALALIPACGNGDEDEEPATRTTTPAQEVTTTSSATIPFAQWQEETAAVCSEFEPQLAQIEAEFGSPGTPAELAALIEAMMPLNVRYIDALVAIELPDERQPDAHRTYELYEAQERVAMALGEAARNADTAGLEANSAALQSQSAELQELLTDLGLPSCL